jgi:hypothetical protein
MGQFRIDGCLLSVIWIYPPVFRREGALAGFCSWTVSLKWTPREGGNAHFKEAVYELSQRESHGFSPPVSHRLACVPKARLPIPGRQFADPLRRMTGRSRENAGENAGEPDLQRKDAAL